MIAATSPPAACAAAKQHRRDVPVLEIFSLLGGGHFSPRRRAGGEIMAGRLPRGRLPPRGADHAAPERIAAALLAVAPHARRGGRHGHSSRDSGGGAADRPALRRPAGHAAGRDHAGGEGISAATAATAAAAGDGGRSAGSGRTGRTGYVRGAPQRRPPTERQGFSFLAGARRRGLQPARGGGGGGGVGGGGRGAEGALGGGLLDELVQLRRARAESPQVGFPPHYPLPRPPPPPPPPNPALTPLSLSTLLAA